VSMSGCSVYSTCLILSDTVIFFKFRFNFSFYARVIVQSIRTYNFNCLSGSIILTD